MIQSNPIKFNWIVLKIGPNLTQPGYLQP